MPLKETTEQYVKRILGNLEGNALDVLTATPGKLKHLVNGRSNDELTRHSSPDAWSVAEIVAHMADTELVVAVRFRKTVSEPGCQIPAYDQNAWASKLGYISRDSNESVENFRSVREMNIRLLRTLTPEQWQSYGNHAERGRETVEHISRLIAGHDINHVRQIERILGSLT